MIPHPRFFVLCAGLLLIASVSARAQDACSACKGAGWVNCPRHRAPVAFEIKHSSCLEWECCRGLGCRPCPKCKPPAAVEKFEKHRIELEQWVQSRREGVDLALFGD
ncbi:MAG: hypothetical protein MUC63_03610, partial [Planctomycetes bacterium]|nr:hypothetical protein [Planctomycetota bacterium]